VPESIWFSLLYLNKKNPRHGINIKLI